MLQKNPNLLVNICRVQLKSVHGSLFPALEEIYTSLSKIKWSSDSQKSAAGIQYKNHLVLTYPGLSSDQFKVLDELISGLYEVTVTDDQGDRYRLAGVKNPMEADTRFGGGSTEILLNNTAIETIEYLGSEEAAENDGFPYTLNFYLS